MKRIALAFACFVRIVASYGKTTRVYNINDGGGTAEDANRMVAEDIDRYPEQFFFGTRPSWGAYIRHARNVEFRNVTLTTRSED